MSKVNVIWEGYDHAKRKVRMEPEDRDHIYWGKRPMQNNFQAIYETVVAPDEVRMSSLFDSREIYCKRETTASYSPRGFATRVVVEFDGYQNGRIVTAYPTKKLEGGNVGDVLYRKEDIRQKE